MNFIVDAPNISIDRMNDVRGQLKHVTPQNTLTIPHAAHNPTGSPNIGAKKLPSVAPTKRVGTISPPLNPPPSYGIATAFLCGIHTLCITSYRKLLAIISEPAPR